MDSYKPYRGSRGGSVGGTIISAVIVLLLLALLAFSIYRYFFYEPEGQSDDPGYGDAPTDIVEPTSADEQPEPSTEEEPTEPTPQEEFVVRALTLSFDDAASVDKIERAVKMCEDGEYNMLVLELKDADGRLGFERQTATAEQAYTEQSGAEQQSDGSDGAQNGQSEMNKRIAELCAECKESNIKTAAKISAFRDDAASSGSRQYAVKTGSGARWLDRKYKGWLNPYSEGAREYIGQIIKELAALGFDRVILDNYCFPYAGKTELISYGQTEQSKEECLEQFASELAGISAECGTDISIVLTAAAAKSGRHLEAGQNVSALCEYFSQVYFAAGGDYFSEGKQDAYLSSELKQSCRTTEFIPMTGTARPSEQADVAFAVEFAG